MNNFKNNKTPKHLVKRGKKGFGLKSFSLAAIAGLTLIGIQQQAVANSNFDALKQAINDETTTSYTLTDNADAAANIGFVGEYNTSKTEFTLNGDKNGITGNGFGGIITQPDKNQSLIINEIGSATLSRNDNDELTVDIQASFNGFSESVNPNAGGAIFAQGGELTVKDSVFSNNEALGGAQYSNGGAIEAIGTNVSVGGSVFFKNSSENDGGALSVHGSSLKVNESSFVENSANQGGGINAADMSVVEITDSLFYGNTAQYGAGASVFKQQDADADLESNLKLSGVTFEANNAEEGRGGGLYANTLSSMIIGENTVFKNNYAKEGGAGIYAQSIGNIDIADGTIFKNNTSADSGSYGGAIFAVTQDDIESSLNIGNDVIFDGNSAYTGGAIYTQTLKELNIGNNVQFTNNSGHTGAIASYDIQKVTIGDNVNFDGNIGKTTGIYDTSYIIDLSASNNTTDTSKLNIGDNATCKNNVTRNFLSSYNFKEVTIGNNAIFQNNTLDRGDLIYASGANKLILGDNLEVKDNIGVQNVLSSGYMDGDDRLIEIGDNATFSGNTGGEYRYYNWLIYGTYIKDVKIGNNLKITDNNNYCDLILTYFNRRNSDDYNTFTIGDNAEISNNTGYMAQMIMPCYLNKFQIGDNLKANNNTGFSSLFFSDNNTDLDFSIGNDVQINNNKVSSELFYLSEVKDFKIGNNLEIIGNTFNSEGIYFRGNGNASFIIGDNAKILENSSRSEFIYAGGLNKVQIGNNFKFNNNSTSRFAYFSFDSANSDNEILIGNNTEFLNNIFSSSDGIISSNSLNKFLIGDNLTISNNSGTSSKLYAGFNGSAIDGIFSIGKNATITNNFNRQYDHIYASGVNKYIIGDNITIKDNKGSYSLYASFAYNAPDGIYRIGDNAKIINNDATIEGLSSTASAIYASGVKDFEMGKDVTIKNNTLMGNYMLEARGNSQTEDSNRFKIGENFILSDNKIGYFGIYVSDFNTVEFGNDAAFSNNTSNDSSSVMYITNVNNLKIGNNTKFVNNITRRGSGAVYMSMDDNLIANFGKNTLFEGNEANGNLGGAIFFGGKELTFADNAQFINNTANPYPNGGTQGQGGAIVMYNSNGNSVLNLLNAKFIGNIATGNSNDSRGGAIYGNCTKEINITSDNGQTLFKDNKDVTGLNDIYLNVYTPTAVNLKSVNNGEIEFNGTIEGDNQFNLNVLGDNSSKVTLNNKIINGATTLENTNLYLGVTDKENSVSDVLAHEGTTMTAKTGTIHLEDNSITDYNVNKLTSEKTKYNIDLDWNKEKADRIVLKDQTSEGKVNLNVLNILNSNAILNGKDAVIIKRSGRHYNISYTVNIR